MNLTRVEGLVVPALVLDEHRTVVRLSCDQLLALVYGPHQTEENLGPYPPVKHPWLAGRGVRASFLGAKERNVSEYAMHIYFERNCMTPPIILYTDQSLTVHEDKDFAYLQIPAGIVLLTIDGATQLAARLGLLFEGMAEEASSEWIPVIICHGLSVEWAKQTFHDLNCLGVRADAIVRLMTDTYDSHTHMAQMVEDAVPLFRGRVNHSRRRLKEHDVEIMTLRSLHCACDCFAYGITAVEGVSSSVDPMPFERRERVARRAIDWFTSLSEVLRPVLENRRQYVASGSAVLAALGAVGAPIADAKPSHLRTIKARQLDLLREVRWDKGPHWDRIAGEILPTGAFRMSGGNRTTYRVYSALTDSMDRAYSEIRGCSTAVA